MDVTPYLSVGAVAGSLALGYIVSLRNRLAAAMSMAADVGKDGLLPVAATRDSDIFFCSYPRSGNTWFSAMVAGLTQGCDARATNAELLCSIVPDVHACHFYKRYGSVCYFKSHHLPQPNYRRVVYLLRDGRDAMVSYYHYQMAMYGAADLLQMVSEKGLWPSSWHEHVETWSANPHGAEMIVLKYEDLKSNPLREMRRFCDFAGLKPDNASIMRVIAQASFENLRGKEKKEGFVKAWPRHASFFRRGQVNSYLDEMPAEVLAAFLQQAGPTLARFGYLVPSSENAQARAA